MRVRLIIVLFAMMIIPLIGLGLLGYNTYKNESELMKHRQEALLLDRLHDVDNTLIKIIEDYERQLSGGLKKLAQKDNSEVSDAIRVEVQTNRLIRSIFQLDSKKRLVFPSGDDLSEEEQSFIDRNQRILIGGDVILPPLENEKNVDRCDWLVRHNDEGVQLIYRCASDGVITGAELDSTAVISDLIGALPLTIEEKAETKYNRSENLDFRIRLLDVNDQVYYQWGHYEPNDSESPSAVLKLSIPLSSFRLAYFNRSVNVSQFGNTAALGAIMGFFALLIVLTGLGIYFVRESSRDARTAKERMTFVNQVSHELKTPLTNLRMYAELLEEYLTDDEEEGRRYVNVIVSESERLSRLIANVLSFAGHTRGKLRIRRTEAVPDKTINDTVERFMLGFAQAGISLESKIEANEVRFFDTDALSQILGNLLSNVEKYAVSGKWVGIESRLQGDTLIITVKDNGEGIPKGRDEEIFKPFVRLSNRLTDRASGAGIGLSIARELARLHGGDIKVLPSEKGACFAITINAPKPPEKGDMQ